MTQQVLFVDDEPALLQGLKRMLRPMRSEWEMTFACGGHEAVEALKSTCFDVVVTDMRMPDIDGARVLTNVKNCCPNSVRIVLSGQAELDLILRAIRPAHQYLAKPCDAEHLKCIVARACAVRDVMRSQELRSMVSKLEALPATTNNFSQLKKILEEPESSIEQVANLIGHDIGMSLKVLQYVNSAFFGVSKCVSDPREAVRILGLDLIRKLEQTEAVFILPEGSNIFSRAVASINQRAVEVAERASQYASKQGYEDSVCNSAFGAGLLHAAGLLILAVHDESQGASQIDSIIRPHRTVEKYYETNYLEVGHYLLSLWGLPDELCEAVRWHRSPEKSGTPDQEVLSAVHHATADIYK